MVLFVSQSFVAEANAGLFDIFRRNKSRRCRQVVVTSCQVTPSVSDPSGPSAPDEIAPAPPDEIAPAPPIGLLAPAVQSSTPETTPKTTPSAPQLKPIPPFQLVKPPRSDKSTSTSKPNFDLIGETKQTFMLIH